MDTTDKPDVNMREIDRRPEELEFVPTAPGTVDIEELEGAQSVSPLQAAVRRFWADKRAVFFLGVVLFIVLGS